MSGRRLVIVGAKGRMGSEISALAAELEFQVAAGVSSSSPIERVSASTCDVVIDFSLPTATDQVITWCVKHKKPLVSGVTGVTEAQMKAFESAGKVIPAFWSPNMSLGIAVLAKALESLAALEGFDFQIEEFHHNRKKDRPSGTANFLQEKLSAAIGKKPPAPLSIRGGGIFGIHRVWAMGEEETIGFEHTAMNRRVFARGALRAAEWIVSQGPGFYRMEDLLR